MQCRRCVLPENKPDIWLNDEGVCNICVDFERRKSAKRSETFLKKLSWRLEY